MRIKSYRLLSQVIFLFLSIIGILGVTKTGLIFPYFFCNASPGAVCVCPLWALEHSSILFQLDVKLAFTLFIYLFGFLGLIGLMVGRSFCGWACPIGFTQDLAKSLKGKTRLNWLHFLISTLISLGMIYSVFVVPNVYTGYLATAGLVIAAISLYGFLLKIDNLLITLGVLICVLLFPLSALWVLWDVIGVREIIFQVWIVLFVVCLLSLFQRFAGNWFKRTVGTKYYDQNSFYLSKYVILALIPTTSFIFQDKWFTNIDPIGGLTAGVPVLMYESSKWVVSDLLWLKFVLIALFFWLILISTHGFCRYVCPIGAIMGFTNKYSIQDVKYYPEKCVKCLKCNQVCPMKIDILKMNRDMECIRCGRCVDACKYDSLHVTMFNSKIK